MNKISGAGSLRLNTGISKQRTSSNGSFQDHFRGGMRTGINLANNAVRQVLRPLPGSAALSASLSDAAANLNTSSRLDGASSTTGATLDGDMGSLQNEMVANNEQMLEQQLRVSQITTSYSTRSYILKAMFDALKTIGSNIR